MVALSLGVLALLPAGAAAQADLGIDKTDSADPATTGKQFSYVIEVTNAGPEAATTVTVDDTLPNRVSYVSASATQGGCELQGSRRVICELGPLASGASATVTIVVAAQRDGTVTNTAEVSSTGPADPVAANNSDTEQTVIVNPPGGGPRCDGLAATIFGTPGDDTLTGTDKRDVIAGLGGDDVITGLDGRDVICGGRGTDIIRSGGDADFVKGGGGNDRIRGQSGDDVLAGNAGNDRLVGGKGNDLLKGGKGDDSCRGGGGRDTVKGC